MKKLYFILLSVFIVISCERDTELEGPLLSDIYGDFKVLEEFDVSDRNIDFANGESTYFSARFTTIADWEIQITGLSSGAKKVISGKSRDLNSENAQWDGSTTYFPMFNIEECAVQLYVENDSSFHYDTLFVDSVKVNQGLLIADFESEFNPYCDILVQSGANMSFCFNRDSLAPQGISYFDMGGEVNWDWLIGMIEFPADAYGNPRFALNSNPTKVHFNVLLYLPEEITNAVVLFQFREDDNEDDYFNESKEDMYSLELKELEPGWQLVTLSYSDFVALSNGVPTDPNGNKEHNPDRLSRISVLMLADPSSGYSQVLMDYMIFTEDSPLIP